MNTTIAPTSPSEAQLHLSDVEFRGETIYFLVLDRFSDGNPLNDALLNELDDPTRQDWNKYWGGDLQGVLNQLDYLQELGVTALWITPLFEQVEALEVSGHAPIHGYWTRDFKRINARWVNDPEEVRLFTREDTIFDRLLAELHSRKMKFVLDIVCNHSSPQTEEGKGRIFDDGRLVADFSDDKENWYHHYGEVTNWEDAWQVQNCELSGLATFNENNILFRRYISEAIKLWLDKGVDAIRVDTAKHMPIWFWQEFSAELQSRKPNVFMFGEWIHNHPQNVESVTFANQAGMSILDFGFSQAIREALSNREGEGFSAVQSILDQDHVYRSATELVTFFENHDMPRLQSCCREEGAVHLALVLILTSRGIPCLYYGCEQYLHNDTEYGQDPYNRPMMENWDRTTQAYHITKVLSQARRYNPAIQWGGQWPKLVEKNVFAYLRRYRDSRCLVVMNQGEDREITVHDTEITDGDYPCLLTGNLVSVKEGKLQVHLKTYASVIICLTGKPVMGKSVIHLQINRAPTQPGDRLAVIGNVTELGRWDLRDAVFLECINTNTWFGEISFSESAGHSVAYKYVILSPGDKTAPHREIRTVRRRPIAREGVTKWRDIWEES
jgi:cyclomaltodextrin glucanotransferase